MPRPDPLPGSSGPARPQPRGSPPPPGPLRARTRGPGSSRRSPPRLAAAPLSPARVARRPPRALLCRGRSGPLAGGLTPSRLPPPISLPCSLSLSGPGPPWPGEIASSRGARASPGPGPGPAGRFRAPGRPRLRPLRPRRRPKWGGVAGRRDYGCIRRAWSPAARSGGRSAPPPPTALLDLISLPGP